MSFNPNREWVPRFADPRQEMEDLRESHAWVTREWERAGRHSVFRPDARAATPCPHFV